MRVKSILVNTRLNCAPKLQFEHVPRMSVSRGKCSTGKRADLVEQNDPTAFETELNLKARFGSSRLKTQRFPPRDIAILAPVPGRFGLRPAPWRRRGEFVILIQMLAQMSDF